MFNSPALFFSHKKSLTAFMSCAIIRPNWFGAIFAASIVSSRLAPFRRVLPPCPRRSGTITA